MKRAISSRSKGAGFRLATVMVLLGSAACSAPDQQSEPRVADESAWITTPLILGAERVPAGLVLNGIAAPSGRVVVRGTAGVAYATSADDQGRFSLRIGPPAVDTLFVVETQNGQEAAPAPDRLLVTRDADGPIALLTPGGPSRRLDPVAGLDVMDGDGTAILASGRAAPGTVVPLTIGGGISAQVQARANGRWIVPLKGPEVAVGGRRYVRPAPAEITNADSVPLTVLASGGGRTVVWATPGGAVQHSWFPDRK